MKSATISTISGASTAVAQVSKTAIPADQLFMCSAQAVTTGTSTGVLKLQASNDIVLPMIGSAQPVNWFDIPGATVNIAGAGVVGIVKTELCYQQIRAVFTPAMATAGTISVNIQVAG